MNDIDINKIRKEFAFLKEENIDKVGKKIIYLDSAATAQKPDIVIESITDYYKYSNSNPGRSAHFLGHKASEELEDSRKTIARYLNSDTDEIIFTRSATDGINIVAGTWGIDNLNEGDEIITTIIEHHANFVPWQELSKKKNIKINIVDIDEDNNLKIDEIYSHLNENTKLVAITAASNVTAEILNLKEIIAKIKEFNENIKVMVDATQLLTFRKVDVKEINCDFLVFSGHKIYGPMGIGILFAKKEILKDMKPYQYGGGMIEYVYIDNTNYRDIPTKFEAGTLNVGGAIGLKTAIEWIENIGIDNIQKHEKELLEYTIEKIKDIKNIKLIHSTKDTSALLSFVFLDIHAHDIASILDSFGIAIRAGHHCAMPIHTRLNISASARVSFGIFNTKEEIDYFAEKLLEARRIMGK